MFAIILVIVFFTPPQSDFGGRVIIKICVSTQEHTPQLNIIHHSGRQI